MTRVGGDDRYATSAKVIASVGKPTADTALLASGTVFADALGAGPLSYAAGLPLAITNPNTLSTSTLVALSGSGVKKVQVVGGTAAVSPTVVTQLTAAGFTVTRVAGIDRSETSAKLAALETGTYSFDKTAVNVASGATAVNGADALGGAALAGKQKRPLLITNNADDAGVLPAYLTKNSSTLAKGTIFGGAGAISDTLKPALEAAAQKPTATASQGSTVTGPNAATLGDGTTAAATSVEAHGLAIPVTTKANTVTFTYKLGTGASCTAGAPRAFVTVGGNTFNSFDESTVTGVTTATQCGTPVKDTTDTFNVSFTVPAGTATDAGIVFDNGQTAQITVSDFVVAGQQINFA